MTQFEPASAARTSALRAAVHAEVGKVVVGQGALVDATLVAMLAGGHVLIDGPPGVSKSLLAAAIVRAMGLEGRRVQFTPDLLPSDLTGTLTMRGSEFVFRQGPVFTNLLLADELNRTPPKTQAALLEAMQERQVSVDGVSHPLPDPFVVLATQNPIDFEGTYPLPESQLDRFLLRVAVEYPSAVEASRRRPSTR
jgi:MoxR-like ATPase